MKYLIMVLSVICVLVYVGCDLDENRKMSMNAPEVEVKSPEMVVQTQTERFRVMKVQMFKDPDAYMGLRCVYVITDQVTKREYLGVSGVGISDLGSHSVGKSMATDER